MALILCALFLFTYLLFAAHGQHLVGVCPSFCLSLCPFLQRYAGLCTCADTFVNKLNGVSTQCVDGKLSARTRRYLAQVGSRKNLNLAW